MQLISKLPFLNIITEVLLMHVPADDTRVNLQLRVSLGHFVLIQTLREDENGLFGFVSDMITQPKRRNTTSLTHITSWYGSFCSVNRA